MEWPDEPLREVPQVPLIADDSSEEEPPPMDAPQAETQPE
jgi:hypothetical protein